MPGFFNRLFGGANPGTRTPGINPQSSLQSTFDAPLEYEEPNRFSSGIGDILSLAGTTLLTGNPAAGAQFLQQRQLQRGQERREGRKEAQQNRLFNYELDKEMRAREAEQRRAKDAEAFLATLPQEQQAAFRASPEALDQYILSQYKPQERKIQTLRRGNQDVYGYFKPDGTFEELSQGNAFAPQAPQGPYTDLGKINADLAAGRITQEQAASAISGGANSNLVKGERELREDFIKLTKPYAESLTGFQKVQQAAQGGTGADDVALVFGLLKTLDPSSTVREGEFATVQNTGGIDDKIRNLYNGVREGQRLTPEQKAQIVSTAERQYAAYKANYDSIAAAYTDIAGRYKYNPQNIIIDYARVQPQSQQGNQPTIVDTLPPGFE